ncbi:hypothetical protein UFOVP164_17 [uncultured Caudovirales phage]|uniref:Uncharacterized protein n=1 Tax=uncultured Caudovirales phage TaxID=2100421 RepID=A0A6J7XMD8_9CAUD|nr:hypothetical protein UFOVP164_17 [uncultured Caudovirales phage]
MSYYYAKQMFLTRLEAGPQSYRKVRDSIKYHFSEVDVKKIRDELEAEGLIELSHCETKYFGKESRAIHFYKLSEPKLAIAQKKPYDPLDITLPSSIFTKQEKANMMSTLKMLEMRNNEKLQKLVQINAYGKA